MTYVVACALATLVVMLALNRQRHDARALSWRRLISPDLRAGLQQLEEQCRLEDAQLVSMMASVNRSRMDRREHAERMLRAVLKFVEDAQPDRLERLRVVRVLAKMTAATMAAPALSPMQFRLPELWAAASLGALAHAVLVSPGERLVLRLYVLSAGFWITLRTMRRAAARPAWGKFERALVDWCALDAAHVQATSDATTALPSEVIEPATAAQ